MPKGIPAKLPRSVVRLLGKLPDPVLAARAGVDHRVIFACRRKLGIPACPRSPVPLQIALPAAIERLLGKVHDDELARQAGVAPSTIGHRRRLLGLAPVERARKIDWSDPAARKAYDRERHLRRYWNDPKAARRAERQRRHAMRPPRLPTEPTDEIVALLGNIPDRHIARLAHVSKTVVRRWRRVRAIPACPRVRKVDWDDLEARRRYQREQKKLARQLEPERERRNEQRRAKTSHRRAWRKDNYIERREDFIATVRARKRHYEKSDPKDRAALRAFYKSVRTAGRIPCYWCGRQTRKGKRHVDHIVPITRGGKHEPLNLCVSCPACNCSKRNKQPEEFSPQLLLPLRAVK